MHRRLLPLCASLSLMIVASGLLLTIATSSPRATAQELTVRAATPVAVNFDIRTVKSGRWSEPGTWEPARVPGEGELVLISPETQVIYDVESEARIRLLQVVGSLTFARDRNTLLNVGILKVQNSAACSEGGFACDFHSVNGVGEPHAAPSGPLPSLEIGTPDAPIPAEFTARIRLHHFEGQNKNDAPAVVCCSARMNLHGTPLSRTWVELGDTAAKGADKVTLAEPVTGWRVGDEIVVTGSQHHGSNGRFRESPEKLGTEERRITAINGQVLTLDKPLVHGHDGTGDFRSEVANLSRNVVIESADPKGARGHVVYHRFSQGSISYTRLAHLGKEGVLGRYALHFHLLGDTNRGGGVIGAAIVDSHNRWITIHGTNYMVVRDCVGYRSVGHGFFLEDGTEVYNIFDRNLGIQAYHGKPLPKQVLPFDPNDGAAFWWSNGRNTFVRNTSCENDEYGFRYDSQMRSNFDSRLMVVTPEGVERQTDIRTIPLYRFEDNEAHTEGLYGMVVAGTDRAAPDVRHPHVMKNLKIWEVHYALRPQVPTMWIENVRIDRAVYGVYRPEFENHAYRNISITETDNEPFNRGLDDDSLQNGVLTVDGLKFERFGNGGIPLIQLSDDNPNGNAASHFRNVSLTDRRDQNRRALVDQGGGLHVPPNTATGVPIFIHDYFGPGRHAKIVSRRSKDFEKDGYKYRSEPPLTGEDTRVAEVTDVSFPQLLDPVDDLPPATAITFPLRGVRVKRSGEDLVIRGSTTDNTRTRRVTVNGVEARDVDYNFHEWEVRLPGINSGKLELIAQSEDEAGNVELTPHRLTVEVE